MRSRAWSRGIRRTRRPCAKSDWRGRNSAVPSTARMSVPRRTPLRAPHGSDAAPTPRRRGHRFHALVPCEQLVALSNYAVNTHRNILLRRSPFLLAVLLIEGISQLFERRKPDAANPVAAPRLASPLLPKLPGD